MEIVKHVEVKTKAAQTSRRACASLPIGERVMRWREDDTVKPFMAETTTVTLEVLRRRELNRGVEHAIGAEKSVLPPILEAPALRRRC